MALKYRSQVDYSQIYAGDRQGFNLGLDGSIFLRKEATPRVFNAPRIGTQGASTGAAAASTDISGGTDDSFNIAVDGGAVVAVALTLAGLTTGAAIEAELETKINAALAAASQDGRVWVFYDIADDHYVIKSQKTGTASTVVVTDATSDNVADDLKIGIANGGTETAGTNDQDFLLYTTGGPTYSQPIESNAHRTGRYHTGIIRQKKVAEFDIDTMINMEGSPGASLDNAIRLLLENAFGTETVTPGDSIIYTQGLPADYFSLVRVSTIFGEYYTGGYVKDYTLDVPGDAPGTQKFTGGAEKASISGIAKLNGAVVSSTDVILVAGQSERFTEGGYVMAIAPDGRTVVAGAAGGLWVDSLDHTLEKLVLNQAVDIDDEGFIVPWHPGAIQQTGKDNIYTDLVGTFKFTPSGSAICVTNINLALANDHVDINNCFGSDANKGRVAGNRATFTLSLTVDLSNENFAELVQTREFGGFNPELVIGDPTSDRYLKITAPKWVVSVPAIELPENGTTPVTFEGILYQSSPGARDPISMEWR